MASVSITLRSARGVRVEALVRFIAESVMPAPQPTERGAPAPAPGELSADGRAFYDACRALVEEGEGAAASGAGASNMCRFLNLVLAEAPRVLTSTVADADIEAAYQVIASFLGSLQSSEEANSVVRLLAQGLVSSPTSRAALRLRILSSLFSGCESHDLKLELLTHVLDYAVASRQVAMIESSLGNAPSWFKTWGLSADAQAVQFARLAGVWTSANQPTKAFECLLKSVTLSKPSEDRNAGAVRLIAAFTTLPALAVAANLGQLKQVTSLRDSVVHAPAWELLQHFLDPSASRCEAFVTSNTAYLASIGVTPDAAMSAVRLLCLNNLIAAAVEDRIPAVPYAEVAAHLMVPVESVDGEVIRGVESGLMAAQLDEVEQLVFPSRSTELVFEGPAWEAVRGRLVGMSTHLHDLLDSLKAELDADAAI